MNKFCASALTVLLLVCNAVAAPSDSQTGKFIYKNNCATCHEHAPDAKQAAPSLAELSTLTAEFVLAAVSSGVMVPQATHLSEQEKMRVSEFVAGKQLSIAHPDNLFRCNEKITGSNAIERSKWNGFGGDLANSRYRGAVDSKITSSQLSRMSLKWAFGVDSGEPRSQPSIVKGKLYFGASNGRVYALDANTGCLFWDFSALSEVRTAITIVEDEKRNEAAIFGDQVGNVYKINALNGKLLWKVKADQHPFSRITGAPIIVKDAVIVPVSSNEERAAAGQGYNCCTFRGSLVALSIQTGRENWRATTIEQELKPLTKGSPQEANKLGPSGAAIWSAPTYDEKLNRIYVGTGPNYSGSSEHSDAIVAYDATTGKRIWTFQATKNDVVISGCDDPAKKNRNCPENPGPNFDFAASPILRVLSDGRRMIIAGQKSGNLFGLDPDQNGKIVWKVSLSSGSPLGGIMWGLAADEKKVYVGVVDSLPSSNAASLRTGQLAAVNIKDGRVEWSVTPKHDCKPFAKGCFPSISAPVTVVNDAVIAGSIDGHLRGYSTEKGKLVWDFDANHTFNTVNNIVGKGGSFDGNGGGVVIVGDMLFVNSGYNKFLSSPGNVLLAFSLGPAN